MENNFKQAGQFWDGRFAQSEYAYGTDASPLIGYLRTTVPSGSTVLFPAEGEGRNAVAAARMGYYCVAFDLSSEGRKKAQQLAEQHNVQLDYHLGPLEEMAFEPESFDAIVLVYAHFFPELRAKYHQTLFDLLKPGGHILIEGFDKNHVEFQQINPSAGGPRNVEMLYDDAMFETDFGELKTVALNHLQPTLNEGLYHVGQASIVHYIGQKI